MDRLTEVEKFLAELEADVTRPDGRWGMHGNTAVDDDYFMALYYVIGRLSAILRPVQNEPPVDDGSIT